LGVELGELAILLLGDGEFVAFDVDTVSGTPLSQTNLFFTLTHVYFFPLYATLWPTLLQAIGGFSTDQASGMNNARALTPLIFSRARLKWFCVDRDFTRK
jgi:hypothetical protein